MNKHCQLNKFFTVLWSSDNYMYKIFSNIFNDKLLINGLFLKKKKNPKNPHDNIVFPKLTCMHAKMSLQYNEYGSIWQNKAIHIVY